MPGKESGPQREHEPEQSYVRTASYRADGPALAAYNKAQTAIFTAECDLSSYRIRYQDVPHVVVLGETPEPEVDAELERILKDGDPAMLPDEVIGALVQRRKQARRLGPWVEGHYRPGRRRPGEL